MDFLCWNRRRQVQVCARFRLGGGEIRDHIMGSDFSDVWGAFASWECTGRGGCERVWREELSCQSVKNAVFSAHWGLWLKGEQSAGHRTFSQRHAAAQGWVYASYVQWREKGPGDWSVFTAVTEMMLWRWNSVNTSETGREDSVLQRVEGQTSVTWVLLCLFIVCVTSGSLYFF